MKNMIQKNMPSNNSRALSPINLLTNKTSIYLQASLQQKKCLQNVLSNLMQQLKKQKQKNKCISMEIQKQIHKSQFWKQKYIHIQSQYQTTKNLQNNHKAYSNHRIHRMAQDNQEEYSYPTTQASEISIQINVKKEQVTSFLGKVNRKRKALSLTHLHGHRHEGNRRYFCEN